MNHICRFAFLVIVLLGLYSPCANATEQYPDYIVINGEKYELYVGWMFPSPLQTYFNVTGKKSPFQSYSTANYRGHVATWEIRDNKLYLTQIDTRRKHGRNGVYFPDSQKRYDTVASPAYFGISQVDNTLSDSDGWVMADWFCGTIVAERMLDSDDENILYSEKSSKREKNKARKRLNKQAQRNDKAGDIYLYVRYGKVVESCTINNDDRNRAHEITINDTSDHDFMNKYWMLYLNQNYIQYWITDGLSYDSVTVRGHGGKFDNPKGTSIVMDLFDNHPINWPFNWENFGLSGAPVANVEVIHDSVFITGIGVAQMGDGFEAGKIEIPMDSVFPSDALGNGRLFCNWMNGPWTIQHTVFDDYHHYSSISMTYVDKLQFLELKDGKVLQSRYYPTSFEQDSLNGLDRAKHFCNPTKVCCTKFGIWLPVDIKKLPRVTEAAEYLGEKDAMLNFFKNHSLQDTTINGRYMIGFGLNCNGIADHFWVTDLRDSFVIENVEAILEVVRQLPQQWKPAKYAPEEGAEAEPVDSYQVLDVTIKNGKFTSAYLHE